MTKKPTVLPTREAFWVISALASCTSWRKSAVVSLESSEKRSAIERSPFPESPTPYERRLTLLNPVSPLLAPLLSRPAFAQASLVPVLLEETEEQPAELLRLLYVRGVAAVRDDLL